MWRRRMTRWRPPLAATASPSSSSPASARIPNRRNSSPPIQSRPGSRLPATPCTAAPPSSTSAPPLPTHGSPQTLLGSASSSAIAGRPGTTASTPARPRAHPREKRRRRPEERRRTQPQPAFPPSSPPHTASRSSPPPGSREPILRSAAHWGVPPALMAGQLMAESGFDPNAGSPAGAQGIAQFMPATAAAYGLTNPYDPVAAIDAEAHLMSDLLHQFGSPELALAAYNAGPAPVEACHCIPPYPETQAYVTRILALIGGAGAIAMPSFEVRLVA